jgi:hypothetical protein
VTITIYSKQGTGGIGPGYQIYYRLNGCSGKGAWELVGDGPDCPTSDTCSVYGTVTLSQNQDIAFAVVDCTNFLGISFDATDNSSTCPGNNATYCDSLDCFGTPFIINSGTSNKNIAITVYVSKLGYLACV